MRNARLAAALEEGYNGACAAVQWYTGPKLVDTNVESFHSVPLVLWVRNLLRKATIDDIVRTPT